MWPWRVKMLTQNLLRLLLLLLLMLKKRVDNNLVQIWRLKFGHKVRFLFRLWAQGLAKFFWLKFRRELEAEVWSVFCWWSFVEVRKYNLGRDSEAMFGQDSEVHAQSKCWCLFSKKPKSLLKPKSLAYSSSQSQETPESCPQKRLFLGVFLGKKVFLAKRSTFTYSMSYRFWKLLAQRLI